MKKATLKDIDQVTDSVMQVYKKVNPSFVENMTTLRQRQEYFHAWSRLVIQKLKIPPLLFKSCTILDVGCGSGEKSVVYAALGARIVGLDVNEKTIALAKKRAQEWGADIESRTDFRVCSVFNIALTETFDMIVSDGMIHHTADAKKAFDTFAPLLKPGGVMILGLAETAGFFQRQLQRFFVNKITGSADESVKYAVAVKLFKDRLERASAVSGRSVESTVYDSFINPQVIPIAFSDVKKWMMQYAITLDCTWPPTELPLQTDSQYHPMMSSAGEAVQNWETLCQVLWMINNEYDNEKFKRFPIKNDSAQQCIVRLAQLCTDTVLKNDELENLLKNLTAVTTTPLPGYAVTDDMRAFLSEIIAVNNQIDALRLQKLSPLEIADKIAFKRLFAGFLGVGMVYYRGTKNIADLS